MNTASTTSTASASIQASMFHGMNTARKEMTEMKDTIYREDAIEAVRFDTFNTLNADEREIAINRIPSAEAGQGWIPCSERLPSESGTYLTTTAKGSVCTDHFYANSNDICGRHWSYHRRREPIAWMPLPTPYKGGDSE